MRQAYNEKNAACGGDDMTRRVLFFRNFLWFTGGHLKVWDYFNHVRSSGDHSAHIHFSRESLWDASNPWLALRGEAVRSWREFAAEARFLAGLDWQMIDAAERERSPVPVINLIQHVRHGRAGDPRYAFLRHRAIRICVGEEIRASIDATGQVNGPAFTILNGLNLEPRQLALRGSAEPESDILVAAIKQPELGAQLARRLQREGRRVELLAAPLLRADYLERVARARVTVFLPNPAEGLYLPPLEGMALGTLVVCARVPGTEYCRAGDNCFYPEYSLDALQAAAEAAAALGPGQRARLLAQADEAVARHDLAKERKAFLDILRHVDELW